MNALRALLFYSALIPLTLLFGTIGLLIRPLNADLRYRIVTTWTHISLWLLESLCGVRCRVHGLEHLPDTPSVVLCKHQSAWETMILQRYLPRQTWVMKQELMRIPFLGWGLGATDPVPVDRSAGRAALKQVINDGAQRLAAGYWLVIFPEGTRVPVGESGRYARSGAALALEAGCPIVPVAHNAGLFWPRNSFAKVPGTIDLVIGPVLETAGRNSTALTAAAEAWIETTSRQLLEPPAQEDSESSG